MKHDPFLVGQILEIALGERADNKVYRAQVSQADERNIVLHVPGFDPLYFVDLLRGTATILRTHWKGGPHIGASKLSEHFKDSSPYLVIRRPEELVPVERKARAQVAVEIDARYIARDEDPIRTRRPDKPNGSGLIHLRNVPEPFDPGTALVVEIDGIGGDVVRLEGRVVGIRRDPENRAGYAMTFAIETLDEGQRERLLDVLLQPREDGGERKPEGVGS